MLCGIFRAFTCFLILFDESEWNFFERIAGGDTAGRGAGGMGRIFYENRQMEILLWR